MMTTPQRFIELLWGEAIPTNTRILVWTLQNKTSFWADSPASAANQALAAEAGGMDAYIGVGLAPIGLSRNVRCPADRIEGIPALWADIDFLDPSVKDPKPRPPESKIFEILKSEGAPPPTIVVHSGHGYHLWWCFELPWIFDTPAQREVGAELANRWVFYLQQVFRKRGYEIDSVGDLARIMRIPGTTNFKRSPAPVSITSFDPNIRYQREDFEQIITTVGRRNNRPEKKVSQVSQGDQQPTLSADANPPFDKFNAMMENVSGFRSIWERTKRGLKDTSPSGWDLSLANLAARADWSDQEIINLLIASRRKHGDDLKLRHDYYTATVATAREGIKRDKATEALEALEALGSPADIPESDKPIKTSALEYVSQILGIPIKGLVKYTSEPAEYRLLTEAGGILLGEIGSLMSAYSCKCKIAEQTGRVIPTIKASIWDKIVQALLDVCQTEEVGKEATEKGSVDAWLAAYLTGTQIIPITDESDLNAVILSGSPFNYKGTTYISGSRFRSWIMIRQGERITSKRMGILLRAYGATPQVMAVQTGSITTTRNLWALHIGGG